MLEVLNGLVWVAVGDGHIFVVVAYLMSEVDDSLDDVRVIGARNAPEVIDGMYAEFSFNLCDSERMIRTLIDIVSEGKRYSAGLQSQDE